METALSFYAPIAEGLRRVETSLAQVAVESEEPIKSLLEHVVSVQGKRVRPSITLLVARMLGCTTDKPILMGAAVELLHLATLIHDDTVDNAAVRRGRATLSSLWGPEVAVLVGDYLFASSAIHVCNTENIRVIKGFSRTIMDLSSGQLSEHFMSNNWGQTREQYMDRIFKKTGSLFATAAESGAVLSGSEEHIVQAAREFGEQPWHRVPDRGRRAGLRGLGGGDRQAGWERPRLRRAHAARADAGGAVPGRQSCGRGVQGHRPGSKPEAGSRHGAELGCDGERLCGGRRASSKGQSRSLAALPDSEAKRALLELSDFVLERHV